MTTLEATILAICITVIPMCWIADVPGFLCSSMTRLVIDMKMKKEARTDVRR